MTANDPILDAMKRMARWYTGDIHDVLDAHGGYGFLEGISLQSELAPGDVICGPAVTVLYRPSERRGVPQDAYHGAIDGVSAGDILVVDASCAEGSGTGELMSTGAMMAGAAATIVHGTVRDIAEVRKLGYPLFARGVSPVGVSGRMEPAEANVPITIGRVTVNPGDIIVADISGVVVVPREVAATIAEAADRNGAAEAEARSRLLAGEKLRRVWPV